MKTRLLFLVVLVLSACQGRTLLAQDPYPVPLRINMGHFENVDSLGRTWLGDGRFSGDLLGIRPNTLGAAETWPPVGGNDIPWFCKASQQFDAINDLGFNGDDNLGDRLIFATVRRDNADDIHPMEFSIPIQSLPGEEYTVNLYFMWCETVDRHSKVTLEGNLVDPDVSAVDLPGQPEQYMRSYDNVDVSDGRLDILIEGCLDPECPGADLSRSRAPVIAAIEILPTLTTSKPVSFTWTASGGGDWNSAENWTERSPPNGSHDAIFAGSIAATSTVSADTPVSVRSIQFDSSIPYAIAGRGGINMVAGTDTFGQLPARFEVLQGRHEFQARVNLLHDATATITSDAMLIMNNALDLGGNTLTKMGAGELSIRNDLIANGGTIDIQQGIVSGNGTISGDVINGGGIISPGNSLSTSPVPEPTSIVMMVLATLTRLMLWRRID